MTTDSTYDLFIQAMNVTNAAMEANADSAALHPLLTACSLELADKDFGVAIYVDDPANPVDFFTIRLNGVSFVLVSHSHAPPSVNESTWNVSTEYLRDVISNPRKYVDRPALLAFDWLRDLLGQTA